MWSFRECKLALWSMISTGAAGLIARHIDDDGQGNVTCYNDELDAMPADKKGWFEVNWLFAECYL